MGKLSFELGDGSKVIINAFHLSSTYRGFLSSGSPLPSINQKIIDSLTYPKEWGIRKHIMKTKNMYSSPNILKLYTISVWLSILPIVDSELDYDGKEVVVTFLTNQVDEKSIDKIVVDELNFTHWSQYAEDYLI